MTSNEQRAVEVLNQHRNTAQETAPTIIHTVEELEALDPDTVLTAFREDGTDCVFRAWDVWQCEANAEFPAVVVATAAQVIAARKALEEA